MCAVQFTTYACYFNLTPLYPHVSRDLGLDAGALGALVGFGGIVSVLIQIPAGGGGDRWGRRPFFAGGMLLLVASLALRWLAEYGATLLIAQVFAGAALGVVSLNALALVAEAYAAHGQGQAMGILTASLGLGQVVGYLVAGALDGAIGWRPMSLWLAALPLTVLILTLRAPGLDVRAVTAIARPGLVRVLASLAHPRRLAFTALAALSLSAGQGATYLLPFAMQTRDLGPLASAVLLVPYVAGSIVITPIAGRLGDRLGTSRITAVALMLGAAALAALASDQGGVPAIIACSVVIGAAVNTVLALVSVRVTSVAGDRESMGTGTILAGVRIGTLLGPFVGPTVAGGILARTGLNAAWLTLAAFLLVGLTLHQAASVPVQQR